MNFFLRLWIFVSLILGARILYGQVSVANCPAIKINSGNPTFPFPQFLEYAAGKTLAKNNAEGVTHADMEKTMREAYEIMSHRCRLTGQTYCGVPYITFNDNSVPHNYNTFVSEGDGYMLIAAAMFADQPTFNGLWMWIHDNRMSKVVKYKDCQPLRPTQKTGEYIAGWKCDETTAANNGDTHSASDGDFDIAMGLLIAYKQWGEFMYHNGKIVKDACGNPISLKLAAEKAIKALVDTIPDMMDNGAFAGYMSGVIGVDGYVKSGNTWGELTMWRATQNTYTWAKGLPTLGGNYGAHYIDYNAPGYFNQFAKFLSTDGNGNAWQINQLKRAEASSDFLVNEAYKQGYIASIGKVYCTTDGTFTFGSFNSGEDFRFAWKSLIGYLWNGNPTTSWDPVTHQVKAGGNTFEKDMSIRHAAMLREPKAGGIVRCKKMGASPDPGQPLWWGVAQIPQSWDLNGDILEQAGSNYALGAGSTAAVASEDLELIADMYRQSELVWDDASTESKSLTDDQRYILSTPKYFHGIFRVLGLLVNSGNMHAPEKMVPAANVKVYMSVDKTYAYQGDNVTYTVQYRNYGSKDATGVTITTPLDQDYTFISANKGGVYNASTHSITWNIGTITGFKSGGLAATMDSVSFTVNITSLKTPRVCLQSTISGSNFENWVSNEYPNHATYTMERNCVDVLANRTLEVHKTANRAEMNPQDIVKFTVNFENKSTDDAWLNGGRSNVYMSYGNFLPDITNNGDWTNTSFYQFYRFWHDGAEAYINMNNYRVSYFMNDINKGFKSTSNPNGWLFGVDNQNDMDKYGYNPTSGPITFAYQKIPAGEDAFGKWNQRIMIRFANTLTAPATHVYDKLDSKYLLHKGVFGPGFIRSRLYTDPATNMKAKVSDDWSYAAKLQNVDLAAQGSLFFPISPGWAEYANPNKTINNYARHSCSPNSDNYDRILVEEFDGYTWRRIQGRGPLPGKEAYNVVIVDTIPKYLKWKGFIDSLALTKYATYTPAPTGANYTGIVKWTLDEMLVGETGNLIYETIAADIGCPSGKDVNFINAAWISSQTDSPDSSMVKLKITCAAVPPIIEPQTSLFKFANKDKAAIGETVTYKLKYVNTKGTVTIGNLNTQTGWKKLGSGNIPKAQGYFSGDQNANPGISGPYFFANEKSYGVNGTLETTWNVGNSSDFYFVFRYTSGTPYASDFKGVCLKVTPIPSGQGTIKFEVLDGTKIVATETSNISYPTNSAGAFNPIDFKVKIQDTKLYVYVNDTETVIKSYSGLLTTTAGYVGIYNGASGNQQKMTAFKTSFDYAFDVTLYDQLPAELNTVTSISNSGTWNQTKNLITWPIVNGPIKANDSLVYTFNAKIATCKSYITNLGMATVYGMDTLKVLKSISCNSSTCTAPTSVNISTSPAATVCTGNTVTLSGTVTPAGSWGYAFKKGTTTVQNSTTLTTFDANASGSYTFIAYDTKDSASCNTTSSAVTVTINPLPKLTVTATPSDICIGGTSLLTVSGASTYAWDNGLSSGSSKSVTPLATTKYSVTGTDINGCINNDSITVKVNPLPTITASASPATICNGESSVIAASGGSTFIWDNGLGTNASKTVSPTTTITYSVTGTDANGCSNTSSTKLTVNPIPTVTLTSDLATICAGETATLTANGATSYVWNNSLPATPTQTVTPSSSTTYSVTGTTSGCSVSKSIIISVNSIPSISGFGPYSDLCTNGNKISLSALPAGGTFKGLGVTGSEFDPKLVTSGNLAIEYSITIAGCTNKATTNIIVKDTSDVTITAPSTTCINGGLISLSSTPTGIFSGKGISGSSFDPSIAGIAKHVITCKVTAANNCISTKTVTIDVTAKPTITFTPIPSTCIDGTLIDLSSFVTPSGGIFSGTGISGNIFDPKVAGDGSFVIWYKSNQGGCIDSVSQIITVNKGPAIVWAALPVGTCMNSAPVSLSATPAGGTFSGIGVTGTNFNPNGLATGLSTITYTAAANGCTSVSTKTIDIWNKPSTGITTSSNKTDICTGEAITIHGNPTGGLSPYKKHTWTDDISPLNSINIEGPTFQTTIANTYKLRYIIEDNHSCADTNSINITVHSPTKPTISAAGPFCSSDASATLTALPTGGVFKGTAITASTFNPSLATIGNNTIWYISTDTWSCVDSISSTIVVNPTPTITVGNISPKCADDAQFDLSTTATASPSLGTWNYTGTAISGTQFNPKAASIGSNPIIYKYTVGNCSASTNSAIVVNNVPVLSFTIPSQACASDAPILLSGNPAGGTFTSTIALTGNKFTPSDATPNQSYDVSYAYQDVNGCNDTISHAIIVYKANKPTTTGANAVAAATNASNIPALTAIGTDITWYSDILLTKKVGTGNSFTPSAATVIDGATGKGIPGEYVYYVTETVNGCVSNIDSARLTLVNCPLSAPNGTSIKACAGDVDAKRTLSVTGSGDEFRWYRSGVLKGTGNSLIVPETTKGIYTYDVAAYSTADACESGKTTISLTINDLPVITINAPTAICENDNPANITVNPTGGVLTGTGITGMTFTPPSAQASPVVIKYEYTDATTSCTNIGTANIIIHAKPTITINPIPNQCSDGATIDLSTFVTPNGGTFSGTSVLSNSFDPKAAGKGLYTLSYLYTDANSCKNTQTTTVLVNPATVPTYSPAGPYCAADNSPKDISTNFIPAGGTITGTGISGNDFTPALAGKGNHVLTYSVTQNGCVGTVTGTIVVNANPTITFPAVNPLCDDAGKISLNAIPYANGQGIYSGSPAVANTTLGGTFDAALATIGPNNTVLYTYTDPATNCSASASISIEVRHTDLPKANDTSKLSVNIPPPLKLSADGISIKWYSDATLSLLKSSGPTFDIPETKAGIYPYWATQTIGGCESKGKMVTGTITDCATPAPTVTLANVKICKGTTVPDLEATGTSVKWYSDAALKNKVYDGNTFPTGETNGTHVYYVTQFLNGCEGPSATVSLTINELPIVSINGPLSMCDDAKDITLTLIPATGGILSGNGTLSPDKFSPSVAGKGSHTITLTYKDPQTTCLASAITTIVVNHTDAPTANDTSKLIINIPPPLVLSAKGTNVKWYKDVNLQTIKGNGSTFTMPETSDGSYTYYATQTIDGCESKPTTVTGTISLCMTPKPIVTNTTISVCKGDAIPDLTANGTLLRWYSDAQLKVKVADGSPFVTGQTSGSTTYYVTQELNGCQGPAEKVILTINDLPIVSITAPTALCGNDNPVTITTIPTSGGILTGNALSGMSFNPSNALNGLNDLTLTYTDISTNCKNTATASIYVTKLSAPVAQSKITSSVNPDLSLSAIAQSNGILEWYKSSNLITTGPIMNQSEKTPDVYNYTVKETLNGCSSAFTPVSLTIIKCNPPAPTVNTKKLTVCPNANATFTAVVLPNASNTIWKDANHNTVSSNISFNPSTTVPGDYTFTITQDTGGCTSVPTIVNLHVNGTRAPIVKTTSQTICFGQNASFESVNMGGTVTWYDAGTNSKLFTGNKFSPSDHYPLTYQYYAVHDSVGCSSAPTTVTLTIAKLPEEPIISENNITVCSNKQPVLLSATSMTGIIDWRDKNGNYIQSGTSFMADISKLKYGESTTYRAISKSTNPECSSNEVYIAISIAQKVAAPTILKSKFCSGTEEINILPSSSHIIWFDASKKETFLESEIEKMTSPGVYKLYASQHSMYDCNSDTVAFDITILPSITPTIEGKDSVCEQSTFITYHLIPQVTETDSLLWHVSDNVNSQKVGNDKNSISVDWANPGLYTISAIVTTADGCMGSTEKTIRVAPYPQAYFNEEATGAEGVFKFHNQTTQDDIKKNTYSEPVDYHSYWNFGRPGDTEQKLDTPVTPNIRYRSGTFNITLTTISEYGCKSTFEKSILSSIYAGLYVPNAFSPTDGGRIGTFRPTGYNLKTYQLSIFDQWGNLIWYSNLLNDGSPAEGWDGTSNGELMKMDSYIWKIDATFEDGTEWKGYKTESGKYSKFGNVLLIR